MGKDLRFYQFDGGDALLVEYPLNEHSRVVEVGGFKGNWTHSIEAKFNCKIYVFEPIDEYYLELVRMFKRNDRIKVYNKGLSDRAGVVDVGRSGDSTGERVQRDREKVYMYEAGDWIKRKGFQIDLMNINCEGGEYGIMDNIISHGLVGRINNFQIQFHDLSSQDGLHRNLIRKELAKTHTEKWCYPWVWESWSKKQRSNICKRSRV